MTAVTKVTVSRKVLKTVPPLSFVRNARLDNAGKIIVSATHVTEPTSDMNSSKCGTVLAATSAKMNNIRNAESAIRKSIADPRLWCNALKNVFLFFYKKNKEDFQPDISLTHS